jgi:hypothetical protein
MAMTQPPRRGNRKTILIVVGSVLAVCCVVGVVGGIFAFRTFRAATGPAQSAAEAFMQDLTRGDSAAAYDKLCQSTRQRTTQAELADIMSNRRPTSYRITGVRIQTINGEVSAAVEANLTYPDGFTDPHTFNLRQEDDTWKVCGNPY